MSVGVCQAASPVTAVHAQPLSLLRESRVISSDYDDARKVISYIRPPCIPAGQGRCHGERDGGMMGFGMGKSWGVRFFGLVACVLLLGGCSSASKYPPAPVNASSADYSYIVGAGDTLNIIVWRNPELSMSVPVRPDGKFSTPLIDEMVAQDKSSVMIARDIEKKLEKYVRDPVVTVIITGFVGPYDQQIRVVGEASKPQSLPYKQRMTVLDVMIAVGGLTDFADGNGATILRGGDSGK